MGSFSLTGARGSLNLAKFYCVDCLWLEFLGLICFGVVNLLLWVWEPLVIGGLVAGFFWEDVVDLIDFTDGFRSF